VDHTAGPEARVWVGVAEHGDLVSPFEEFDVLVVDVRPNNVSIPSTC
jgi:hypothetical protein